MGGTNNQLFVFGSVKAGYNSNVFSDATDRGDSTVGVSAGAELKRLAGIIGVTAEARIDYTRYEEYPDESAVNPYLNIEFQKTNGRIQGRLKAGAFRESRSDSAVNLRTNSWSFPLELNLKYPINQKIHLGSQTGYTHRSYIASAGLADYTDYSEGLDVFYAYSSKLDLVGGYRIRLSQTSIGNDNYDHWFNVGATGALLAKLTGTIRVGYQIRDQQRGASFSQANAMAGLEWPMTRKLGFTGQISRDFNTIATGSSVDSSSATLRTTYSLTRKLDLNAGITYGRNLFLGAAPAGRRDHFTGLDGGLRYQFNEHLQFSGTYTYFKNSSTLAFSDYDRQLFSFAFNCRY